MANIDLTNKDNSELINIIETLSMDKVFNCYTRQAFESFIWNMIKDNAKFAIFFDVDKMHDANEKYGYELVNEKIRNSVNVRNDDICVSRWFSGDEMIAIINNGDPYAMAQRLLNNFIDNGLSSTFGIVEIDSNKSLLDNVTIAANKVQQAKKENKRGTIN